MPIPANINADVIRARRRQAYVVVADGGQARIFRARGANGSAGLDEIARLERPSAHKPARELTTDLSGRINERAGRPVSGPRNATRHGVNSNYDPHAVEVERFVKRLARRMDTERRRNHVDEWVLIAEPRLLGVLRQQLSAPTRKLLKREIARDLIHADERLIQQTAFAKPSG